jgi:hypothetical protein
MGIEKKEIVNALHVLFSILKAAKLSPDNALVMVEQLKEIEFVPINEMPSDFATLNHLENLLKDKCCRITFNYDREDGFFCQINALYSSFNQDILADLEPETKRETLNASLIAAIKYLENYK